jgi:hypothetical protein
MHASKKVKSNEAVLLTLALVRGVCFDVEVAVTVTVWDSSKSNSTSYKNLKVLPDLSIAEFGS